MNRREILKACVATISGAASIAPLQSIAPAKPMGFRDIDEFAKALDMKQRVKMHSIRLSAGRMSLYDIRKLESLPIS